MATKPHPGFFSTDPPKADGERYAEGTREDEDPWGPHDDLLLWPVLYNCRSEYQYRHACERLCGILDREPPMPPAENWSPKERQRRRVKLIQMRTETRHMADCPEARPVIALARALGPPRRSGRPTWGEAEMIRQWGNKSPDDDSPKKRRGAWSDMLILLDRPSDDRLANSIALLYTPEDGPSPFDKDRAARTEREIARWRAEKTPAAWSDLCRWLNGGPA